MFKDNAEVVLTREEALRLHRKMWTDMQKELGDNAYPMYRTKFKNHWLERHGYAYVLNSCFLCEYTRYNGEYYPTCNKCPIEWSPLAVKDGYPNPKRGTCGARYVGYHVSGPFETEIYLYAPISEILALPERKKHECNN